TRTGRLPTDARVPPSSARRPQDHGTQRRARGDVLPAVRLRRDLARRDRHAAARRGARRDDAVDHRVPVRRAGRRVAFGPLRAEALAIRRALRLAAARLSAVERDAPWGWACGHARTDGAR